MTEYEKMPTGLLKSGAGLRQMLLDYPDLPLLVFAGEDANSGDYYYMSCCSVNANIGEFLDCEQTINDERIYEDRDDFRKDVADLLADMDENCTLSDDEFDAKVDETVAQYDPYWKKCIIVYVDN